MEAKLHAEEQSHQQIAPKAKGRGVKLQKAPAKSTAKTKAGRVEEEKQRVARLEAILAETELEIKQRSKKEQQLQEKIQALYKTEVEQLQRVEEAKARLGAQEAALQVKADEEAGVRAEVAPEAEAVSVNPEPETPQLAATEDDQVNLEVGIESGFESSLESVIEIDLESGVEDESLHPLETWQFAIIEEPELVNGLEEVLEPVAATTDEAYEIELPGVEVEREFDLQAELARLEGEVSLSQTVLEDAEKSVDLLQTEKGIQNSTDKPESRELVEGLKSVDPVKRAAALQGLAQLEESEAFHLITGMFDDTASEVRNLAARALYDFKPDRAASFTRALREGSPERRRHIAVAINASGLATEAINSLAGESREKTYDAFSILFLMAKAGEVQTLLQSIEKHPDIAVRLAVIRVLTFSSQPDIIPAFRSLAVRASLPTEVRSAVMEAIYQISRNARENSLSAA